MQLVPYLFLALDSTFQSFIFVPNSWGNNGRLVFSSLGYPSAVALLMLVVGEGEATTMPNPPPYPGQDIVLPPR
jgi:hypothetical protein